MSRIHKPSVKSLPTGGRNSECPCFSRLDLPKRGAHIPVVVVPGVNSPEEWRSVETWGEKSGTRLKKKRPPFQVAFLFLLISKRRGLRPHLPRRQIFLLLSSQRID